MSTTANPVPRLADRTPLDWRDILIRRLNLQAADAALYEDYYDGRHPLQFATTKFREAFGHLFAAFADNWCQIVVDAAVERLEVVGFQVDGSPSDDAWEIWQDNSLDVESVIAHTEAGKSGHSYLLVDPNEGEPRITVEHASQMIVVRDPSDRRKRLAALKRWLGEDGYVYATLYLPDMLYKWESEEPLLSATTDFQQLAMSDAQQAGLSSQVTWADRSDADPEMPNPMGVVPVIPMVNKPGLLGLGHSDLEPAVPLQNAVNKLCTDMIIASEYGAFRQRVLTGVEIPKDPETGQAIASVELKATLSRMWAFDAADAKVYDLNPTDLTNFVNAIEMFIQHLAAQTRTPPHYLLAKLVNASGDALSVAEAGLTSKCKAKRLFFSDPWEEAIALALSSDGEDVAMADCESTWASPERTSQAVLVDAAVKKKSLGIPLPQLWLELGYTPEQIKTMVEDELAAMEARLEEAATREAALEKLTIAPATAPGQVPPPGDTLSGGATATATTTTPAPPAGPKPAPAAPPPAGGKNG